MQWIVKGPLGRKESNMAYGRDWQVSAGQDRLWGPMSTKLMVVDGLPAVSDSLGLQPKCMSRARKFGGPLDMI